MLQPMQRHEGIRTMRWQEAGTNRWWITFTTIRGAALRNYYWGDLMERQALIEKLLPLLPENENGALSAETIQILMGNSYSVGAITKALKKSPLVESRLIRFNNIKLRLYWKKSQEKPIAIDVPV